MADEKLRLFVAVQVPDEHLAWLEEATGDLSSLPGARWTPRENRHVTLSFLGWLRAALLPDVVATTELVAAAHSPASVALDGLGAFPRERRARVLWAGVDDPNGLLPSLAVGLGAGFEPLGVAPEARAYAPHLTLARFKNPGSLEGLLPAVPRSAPFLVERITLYRSRLSPRGPRYEVLHEAYLTGAGVSR
ncbi:MAG: RNA 2',3'-cyclic phosphodiesterase [Actinomycetota bacterium]|nr:RNA 2',3'-cyclic phosphodiesterase [Actinomycetota bacterium]